MPLLASRAAALALCALAAGCPGNPIAPPPESPESPVDPTAQDFQPPPLPQGRVVLQDAFGARHVVQVEIAATLPLRTRGLMWRTHLADGEGMLFAFPQDAEHSFWMRNTLIPLDMLFLDSEGRVVGIVAMAPPRSLDSRTVGVPSRYVLEVPGGWTGRTGIRQGSKAELQLPPLRIEE